MALGELRMHFPDITEYVTKFETLARQAGYTQGNTECTNIFLAGLPEKILSDVLSPPAVELYEDVKRKAIACTQSRVLLDTIIKSQREGPSQCHATCLGGPILTGNFPRTPHPQPYRPFFSQNRGGGQGGENW